MQLQSPLKVVEKSLNFSTEI